MSAFRFLGAPLRARPVFGAALLLGVCTLAGPLPVRAAAPAPAPAAAVSTAPAADPAPSLAPLPAEPGRPALSFPRPPRGFPRRPLSFGMVLGLPVGLTVQGRFLERHAVVGTAAYDFIFRGVTLGLDYRFTFWTFELLRYDARLGLWAGVGAKASVFEPRKRYQLLSPVALGAHLPAGVTLRLADLPAEFTLVVSPLGMDVNGLTFPRWRPMFGLETRIDFPLDLKI